MPDGGGGGGGAALAEAGARLLAEDDPGGALRVLRAAEATGFAAPSARINLALAEGRAGDPERARTLLVDIEARCPDWSEPPLRLAESLRADDPAAAEAAYRRVLDKLPTRFEALLGLGAMLLLQGRGGEALPLLLRACGRNPESGEAWHALGLALLRTGDAAAAEGALLEAQRRLPGHLEVALHRAQAAMEAGNLPAALALLEVECDARPLDAGLHVARAELLDRAGRTADALDALEAACALQPDLSLPHRMLGGLLARVMRPADAEAPLRRALEIDPDDAPAANELAGCLMRLHRAGEARAILEDLVARGHAATVPVLCNLATALVSLGEQAEAVATARRAVALDEHSMQAWRTLVNALPYGAGVQAVNDALGACAALLRRGNGAAAVRTNPDPDRRLRVGLLSGTMRTHPVGWLTLAGWEALDKDGFELVCLGPQANDPMARRFAAAAAEWHDTSGLRDEALAALCRSSLALDMVVDLGGYGDAGRLTACARRLAPVQIKWVGMQFHSTGLPEVDWFLTDRWETPEGFERLYAERLLRMPDGYVCYTPPPYAPDVTPLPALARGGAVTFGCFNNIAKMTPEVFAAWAAVLRRLPVSRLVLKTHQFSNPAVAARVRAVFAGHGIAEERLELRGASPHRQFLAEYGDVDLVLDPFPYSGGLTTCEALWMGVPTVTLPGESFASRHTLSHQCNAGLDGWAAGSVEDYVDLAVRKAADLDVLAALRAGLRARVAASPLCDGPRFGRSLGAALRGAWRRWCEDDASAV